MQGCPGTFHGAKLSARACIPAAGLLWKTSPGLTRRTRQCSAGVPALHQELLLNSAMGNSGFWLQAERLPVCCGRGLGDAEQGGGSGRPGGVSGAVPRPRSVPAGLGAPAGLPWVLCHSSETARKCCSGFPPPPPRFSARGSRGRPRAGSVWPRRVRDSGDNAQEVTAPHCKEGHSRIYKARA